MIWGLTLLSPRDMASFMRRLPSYVPRRHRRYALGLLAGVVPSQRWGMPPVKPRGWHIHFKGGWIPAAGGWRTNQVALLRNGRRRLGVAVLTSGNPSLGYGAETISGVAARLLRRYNDFGR